MYIIVKWVQSVEDQNLMAETLSHSSSLRKSKSMKDQNSIRGSKRSRSKGDESLSDIIMAKIQEIFGNDVEVYPTKKQRRYRSLVSIYMVTRPVNAANDTRVKA